MITQFLKASTATEAERIRTSTPNAVFIAGGTHLLAPELRGRRMAAISIEGLVSRALHASADRISIGALATLQELLDFAGTGGPGSPSRPDEAARESGELELLCAAARGLANRNVRNRATVGGNIAADRPASTLVPALLALDAELRLAGGRSVPLSDYLDARRAHALAAVTAAAEGAAQPAGSKAGGSFDPTLAGALIDEVVVPIEPARRCAYGRWARTENDLSGVSVAVAFGIEAGRISDLCVVATGIADAAPVPAAPAPAAPAPAAPAPAAAQRAESESELGTNRLHAVEALFEGGTPPGREGMEAAIAPLIRSVDDVRASAAYKRLRGAQLVAQAIHEAFAAKRSGPAGQSGGASSAGRTEGTR